jgi:hypothetical protein
MSWKPRASDFASMLEARIVCYEGRVMDAMALYDGIVQAITPDTNTFLSAQRK